MTDHEKISLLRDALAMTCQVLAMLGAHDYQTGEIATMKLMASREAKRAVEVLERTEK